MSYYGKLVDMPLETRTKDQIVVLIKGLRSETDIERRSKVIKRTIDAIDFCYEDKNDSYSDYMQLCLDMAVSLLMGCEGKLSKLDRCTVCSEALHWLARLDGILEAKETKNRDLMKGRVKE